VKWFFFYKSPFVHATSFMTIKNKLFYIMIYDHFSFWYDLISFLMHFKTILPSIRTISDKIDVVRKFNIIFKMCDLSLLETFRAVNMKNNKCFIDCDVYFWHILYHILLTPFTLLCSCINLYFDQEIFDLI